MATAQTPSSPLEPTEALPVLTEPHRPEAAPQAPAVVLPEDVLEEVRSGALADWKPEQVIRWGLDHFAPRVALSASFGAPEGMAILHMMHAIAPEQTRVFTIDTGRLPQETYNLMDRVRDKYRLEIEVYFPRAERVEAMVRAKGHNLFYETTENRKLCCAVRKVEPLNRALTGLDAWFSGLRRGQSVTREDVVAVEVDDAHGGRIKLNPLATWTREEVLEYVERHELPINALHASGYPSVGCGPCSRAVRRGEDERAGRWWWENPENRECGIHTEYEAEGSGI